MMDCKTLKHYYLGGIELEGDKPATTAQPSLSPQACEGIQSFWCQVVSIKVCFNMNLSRETAQQFWSLLVQFAQKQEKIIFDVNNYFSVI